MAEAHELRQVSYLDCPGSAQVMVDGTTVYIGYLTGPVAPTIIDAADPARPRQIGELRVVHPANSGNMVCAKDGLIVTNFEVAGHPDPASDTPRGGIAVLDAADPADAKLMAYWESGGPVVGRFSFDGRYAFLSAKAEGYDGSICKIVDLNVPYQPEEISRWHVPGQWHEGGEQRSWPAGHVRCLHPIQYLSHLYVGCWYGGGSILDISDARQPNCLCRMDWPASSQFPTNTCVPVPKPVRGFDVVMVADADQAGHTRPGCRLCGWSISPPSPGRHHLAVLGWRPMTSRPRRRLPGMPSRPTGSAVPRSRSLGRITACASSTSKTPARLARSPGSCWTPATARPPCTPAMSAPTSAI